MFDRKFVAVVPDLGVGGAQRVSVNLCNFLAADSHLSVTLIVLTDKTWSHFAIHPDIEVIRIYSRRSIFSLMKLKRILIGSKPDFLFSSLPYVSLIVGCLKHSIKVLRSSKLLVREANIPLVSLSFTSIGNVGIRWLSYLFADTVICSSQQMSESLLKFPLLKLKKLRYLPNPFDFNFLSEQASISTDCGVDLSDSFPVKIAVVGRLEKHKRVGDVLEACASIKKSCPTLQFEVWIIGSGSEYPSLQDYVKSSCEGDWIRFFGRQNNPWALLKHCRCLVIASEWEGFPNIIVESLYLGLSVISANTAGCVSEIKASLGDTRRITIIQSITSLAGQIKCFLEANEDQQDVPISDELELQYGMRAVGSKLLLLLREMPDANG